MYQWLKFPTFDDPEKTSTARLLLIITLMIIGLSLFFDLVLVMFYGSERSFVFVASVALVAFAVHIAARRGYVRASAITLCLFIWVILTVTAVTGQGRGVYDLAFSAYIAPVLLAGFLINGRTGFVFAIMSTLSGLVMLIRASFGTWIFYDAVLYWAAGSLYFCFASVLLWIYERRIRRARERTLRHETQLEERSRELQREVAERTRFEEAYRTVVENSLQGLTIFQNNRIVFANTAMADMLGYSLEELFALENVRQLVHPEDQMMTIANLREHPSGQTVSSRYEVRALHRSGEMHWFEVFPVLITYQGQPAVQYAIIDISERKKAEQALKRSQEWFAKIFQTSPVSISIARKNEGDYVDVNPSWCRLFGYSREEALGRTGVELALWDEAQRARFLSAVARDDRIYQHEFQTTNRSGAPLSIVMSTEPIELDGQPYLLSLASDITERKKTEAALREREESARQFQEKLKLLHEISITLSTTESFDELCRRAIVLGRGELGFDRLGLLLLDEHNQRMLGTYGTDTQGRLRDERAMSGEIVPSSWVMDVLRNREFVVYHDDTDLYDSWQKVGRGWSAMAVLWDGNKSIGWLAADNLTQQKPLLPYQLELLKLYGLALGHLVTRKRTEEAEKRSQEWFAKIFRSSPISISISTIPEGRYVDVNPSWCSLFGYTREEVLGHTGLELGLWNDEPKRKELSRLVLEHGGFHQREVNLRHRDGSAYTAMMSAELVELNGKQHYLTMVSDITEHKKIEAALREREESARQLQEKLKALHEVSIELTRAASFDELCRRAIELGRDVLGFERIGLLLFDAAAKAMVGTFGIDQYGNVRDERDMRYSVQEDELMYSLLMNRESIYYHDDAQLYDFGQPIGYGWNMMTAMWDGSTSIGWLATDNLVSHKPLAPYQLELFRLYGLTLGHLVTRKRTEEALRRSEEWFSKVFRIAPFAVGIGAMDDGRYIDVNDSWCALFGFSREEVIGHNSYELKIWDNEEHRLDVMRQLTEEGRLSQIELEITRRDGTRRSILLSTETIDFNGKPHYISTIADITERKQVEQQRLELALVNERLELFREFMTNVSHDLKTPLSVINTSVELMERIKDPERQKEKMVAIKEQTARLDKYIQDMLTISRLDHAPDLMLHPVDLNRAVADVEERLRLTAEKKEIETRLELEPNTPYVLADESELDRMLVNLVENALNYTPAGGCVWIRTRVDGDNVIAEIADTGIGIGEKDLVRIFDRFYRADTARSTKISGTGLGLAIVKRIVEMHSGTITVQSIQGEGTTFRVLLPVIDANGI